MHSVALQSATDDNNSICITDSYVACGPECTRDLPRLVIRMLRLFDGTRTVQQVCDSIQISVNQGQIVVKKLLSLGMLEPAPASPARASSPLLTESLEHQTLEPAGFSALEEAFFASEVQPCDECDEPPDLSLSERVGHWLSWLVGRLTHSPSF